MSKLPSCAGILPENMNEMDEYINLSHLCIRCLPPLEHFQPCLSVLLLFFLCAVNLLVVCLLGVIGETWTPQPSKWRTSQRETSMNSE